MFAHFISRHAPRLLLPLCTIAIGSSNKRGKAWKRPPPRPQPLSWGGGWQDPGRVASPGWLLSSGGKDVAQDTPAAAHLSRLKCLHRVCNISCVASSCCKLFCRGCLEPQVRLKRALLLKTAFFFFFPLHGGQTIRFGHDHMNENFLPGFSSSSLQGSHQT